MVIKLSNDLIITYTRFRKETEVNIGAGSSRIETVQLPITFTTNNGAVLLATHSYFTCGKTGKSLSEGEITVSINNPYTNSGKFSNLFVAIIGY